MFSVFYSSDGLWSRTSSGRSTWSMWIATDSHLLSPWTRSIPGWWIGLPNVPYQYVFSQLSSEASHLHRTPLKSHQSTKIRTTVIWGACERKSRSSFSTDQTLVQIHTASNYISFKYNIPIALYSLRFMIHAKTKPNNSHRGVGFSWAFFFRFVAYQPHQLCQISCANN